MNRRRRPDRWGLPDEPGSPGLPRWPATIRPAWELCQILDGDNTRVYPRELPDMRPILVRTDTPISRPVAFRRPRRERLIDAAARCALTLYYALVLGLAILGGSWLVRSLADAAARWVGGN